jgi:predicted nucleic acid-binding protein
VKALFDTNILIDYLAGSDNARKELTRYDARLVSVVTWMEVLAGARNDAEEDVIRMFLRDFTVVEISKPIAQAATTIRRKRRVRLPDAMIWATAEAESALLVTRNTKDFPKHDPGVRVPY